MSLLCKVIGHTEARDGSWCLGAKVCGRCHQFYDAWPAEKTKMVAEAMQRAEDRGEYPGFIAQQASKFQENK